MNPANVNRKETPKNGRENEKQIGIEAMRY